MHYNEISNHEETSFLIKFKEGTCSFSCNYIIYNYIFRLSPSNTPRYGSLMIEINNLSIYIVNLVN